MVIVPLGKLSFAFFGKKGEIFEGREKEADLLVHVLSN